jgi:hypothetical protein
MVEGENEDKDAHPTSPAENEFLIFQRTLLGPAQNRIGNLVWNCVIVSKACQSHQNMRLAFSGRAVQNLYGRSF